ncbi:MAG: capsid protein [Clostridia bacterium]|nr:capsid protein [Clostridia bacterium]
MAFEKTGLNYAKEYSQALAQAYPYVLYFGALWNAVKPDVKFLRNDTVILPSLSVKGRKNGDRDSIGTFGRNFNNDEEPKKLKTHRTWDTLIHPRDIDETNHVATIQNITKVMNEEQKFPEMDAEIITALYSLKNAIEAITEGDVLTLQNVLTKFDALMDKMDEARVPASGRLLYCDTYTKTLIDTAKEAARNLSATDTAVARSLDRIGEVEIIGVPTTAMKSAFKFTDDGFEVQGDEYEKTTDEAVVTGKTYYTKNGDTYTVVAEPSTASISTYYEKTAEAAKDVKMMLIHPSVVVPVISYDFAQLGAPSSLSQGKWTYFEESFEDVFIFNKKHAGIQFYIEQNA